jgi:hypothetical protein
LVRIVLCFVFAVFFLTMVPPVHGQVGMAPQLKEVKIFRGGRQVFHLLVKNHGSETISLHMLADDMDLSEAGAPTVAGEGYERGCANWVTFTPKEFTVDPKSSQDVRVMVKAPKEAIGSYSAILRCQAIMQKMLQVPAVEKGSTGLEFTVGVGSLLLATVTSSQNTVILNPDTVTLDPGRVIIDNPLAKTEESGKKAWLVEVPVANDGNVYTIVQGDASIWTPSGRLVGRAPLFAGRGFVFPNGRRIFKATGEIPLSDGAYLVRANIRSREGRSRSGSFPFTVVNGVAHAGSDSEELDQILRASLPGFSLQNQYVDFDVQPGSRRTKGVMLTSDAQDTLKLTARLLDWNVDETGNIELLSQGKSPHERSCTPWISVDPNPLLIPPGQKKVAKLVLEGPKQIDGEYYAAVLFDPEGTKSGLPSEFQIPRALFVAASDKRSVKPSAEISFAVNPARKGCSYEIVLNNTGNVHCFATGRVNLLDDKGDRVTDPIEFGSGEEFVLPGGMRMLTVPWQAELQPGRYRAEVTVDFYKDTPGLREGVSFEVK